MFNKLRAFRDNLGKAIEAQNQKKAEQAVENEKLLTVAVKKWYEEVDALEDQLKNINKS